MIHEPRQNRFVNGLTGYIFFLFSIQVITIGLSLLHVQITSWVARAVLAVALAVALLLFFQGRRGGPPESLFPAGWRAAILPFLFLGFAALIYLLLWLAAYIMPDLSWDGNAYHIPAMAMWDMQGYIHWVKTPYLEGIINGYPKGMELVSYITVKAVGNSVINATNLLFLPLGVLGIAVLASLLGASPWLSLCVGAAFILVPVNINQAVTSYVDSAFASAAIALLAMTACVCLKDQRSWRNIAAFGAALGLALSVKSTGVALGGLAFLAVISVWIFDQVRTPPDAPVNSVNTPWTKKIASLIPATLSIIGIAIAAGGYWYLRNWILSGSPLYPAGLSILGHTIFPGPPVAQVIFGESNTLAQIKNLPPILQVFYTWLQGLKAWPLSLKGYDSRLGGLGFLWLLGCIPAVIVTLARFGRLSHTGKRVFLVLLVIVGLSFLITPLNWWARYTVWIYGLGLPVLAWVLTELVFRSSLGRTVSRVGLGWLALLLVLVLFESTYSTIDVIALASPGPLRSHLATFYKSDSWKWPSYYLNFSLGETAMKDVLQQYENVAIGPHGDMEFLDYYGMVGELSQPLGARRLIFLDESGSVDPPANLSGIRYILWDESVPTPPLLQSRAESSETAEGWIIFTLPETSQSN